MGSVFEFFVDLLKKNSKQKIVKVSNFGTFYTKNTPQRLGRNPKTKEEFIISKRSCYSLNPLIKLEA